jgi:hypothetical protein
MLQAFFQRMRRSAEMIDGTESKEKATCQRVDPYHNANCYSRSIQPMNLFHAKPFDM